jgi:hypothetical protein
MECHMLLDRLATGERLKEHEIDRLSEYVCNHFNMKLWQKVMGGLLDGDDTRGARRFHNAVAPKIRGYLL